MALIKKYEREIKDLKQELAMHDSLSNRSHVQYEPFGEQQRLELQKLIKNFIEEDEGDLEVIIAPSFSSNSFKGGEPTSNSRDIEAIQKTLQNEKLIDSGDSENIRHLHDFDRDERVGDIEQNGFGVGLAPNMPQRQTFFPKKQPQRKKIGKIGLALTGSEGLRPDDDDESYDQTRYHDDVFHSSLLPALPNTSTVTSFNITRGLQPQQSSRAQEFETFKREKGSEIFRILSENKGILKERKKAAKDLVDAINSTKYEIDRYREMATFHRGTSKVVIGSEDFEAIEKLKLLKKNYKEQFDTLKQTRLDIVYCSKLVDQCRQKLMSDFEQWYGAVYGTQAPDFDMMNAQNEDVMDIGEKFDRLQIEKMSQEDPDSLPFYNARKNTERRNYKLKMKPHVDMHLDH
ncbi:Kinesin-like protein kif9 [Dinochytrium kinnereticum]|nr:Kinesin-like protein kif9 [Dinochytrium kinnereticum]